ncbi:MAG: molybdopterin molybdotransferase MoeA, partial [Planctomycetaceae bacterium]
MLARRVISPIDVPGFDRSAMDGYAVRAAETVGAGDYNPLGFRIIGESLPGRPFTGAVAAGTAVRIMTGAPLPDGADAVVPAEYAAERAGHVELTAAVSPGKHIGRTGEDIRAGGEILPALRTLRPQDVGVLASIGLAEVAVIGRPRVRILITGNELVAPGQLLPPFQIYEANSSLLTGLVARDGGIIESLRHVEDDRAAIRAAMLAPGADVVLVSGGSSVGAEDHAPSILADVGELALHGLAMRPSSPAGMGRIGAVMVFLLPGNPVSCLCAYDFFAGRGIRRLGGRPAEWPYRPVTARLRRKIVSAIGRVDYCRVRLDGAEAEPLAVSGASILTSTT